MTSWRSGIDEMKIPATSQAEDHLILLQEKMRQQRRLKKVDEKQQELAKREKGFTLYVNGANAALPHSVPAEMAVKVTRTARRPKTQRSKAPTEETNNANGAMTPDNRAKSAPNARVRRRQWQAASIELKTTSGDNIRVKAPGAISGNYADDFEDDEADSDSIEEEVLESDSSDSVVEECETAEQNELDDKFDGDENIVNTIRHCNELQVKKLRESLEMRNSVSQYRTSPEQQSNPTRQTKDVLMPRSSSPSPEQSVEHTAPANKAKSKDMVESLVQKISNLDVRQQKQLMELLAKMDDSPRASTAWVESDTPPSNAGVDSREPSKSRLSMLPAEENSPAVLKEKEKRTDFVRDKTVVVSNADAVMKDMRKNLRQHKEIPKLESKNASRLSADMRKSADTSTPSLTDCVLVELELLSNWDHPRLVGLTEIELLDHNGKKIEIDAASDVELSSHRDAHNRSFDISALFNGKTKDLSVGVKRIRVSVNGRLTYEGDLSRGNANQIFEYDQVISLTASSSVASSAADRSKSNRASPAAAKTSSLLPPSSSASQPSVHGLSLSADVNDRQHSSVYASDSNENDTGLSQDGVRCSAGGAPLSARHRRRNRIKFESGTGQTVLPTAAAAVNSSISPDTQPAATCVQVSTATLSDDMATAAAPSLGEKAVTVSNSQSGQLPSWLTVGDENVRPSSGASRGAEDENLLEDWPGCRGNRNLPTLLDVADTGLSQLADQDEEPVSRMKQLESARAARRKRTDFSLEESWTSLDLFNRCQKGRLSLDIQDDVLDEYLNTERTKPKIPPSIPEVTTATSSLDCSAGDVFTIPELPRGQHLVVNICTTWGDRHYVGLNGIEIFSSNGQPVTVAKISAEPSDINILPEYKKDPRVVTNLIDGVNRTQDDTHMWLAPFTAGQPHYIYLTFEQPTCISVMRIWNYNKSRIHSTRGAKDIEITLDGVTIFVGEITRACGGMTGSSDSFGDTILFTMDEDILELVAENDQTFEIDASLDYGGGWDDANERPPTADNGSSADQQTFTRPATCATGLKKHDIRTAQRDDSGMPVFQGRYLVLGLAATWGDQHYIGLTGLEVIGRDGEIVSLDMSMIDASPRDLHHLPGHEDDDRTLDKLIDGENVTMSDEHMWLIPFTEGDVHEVRIDFGRNVSLTALRVWNYNKSSEDTFRGVHTMHVTLDNRRLSPTEGFLIRKGPGNCYFDFAQQINFGCGSSVRSVPPSKDFKTSKDDTCDFVLRPRGFIYQFQLLSSWSDPYYVGLNGLEFFDTAGNLMLLTETNIAAYPDSVNVLPDVINDIRTPDKLIDGVNDTTDGRHMWLAPILPNIVNRIYVLFDEPVELSMIRIWNYSKTAARGVRDIALLVDDLLVYNGTVESASVARNGGKTSTRQHTIYFTDTVELAQRDRHETGNYELEEQQIRLMNDRKVIVANSGSGAGRNTASKIADPALRPTTSMPRSRADKPAIAR